jgi:hypothetical protein
MLDNRAERHQGTDQRRHSRGLLWAMWGFVLFVLYLASFGPGVCGIALLSEWSGRDECLSLLYVYWPLMLVMESEGPAADVLVSYLNFCGQWMGMQ